MNVLSAVTSTVSSIASSILSEDPQTYTLAKDPLSYKDLLHNMICWRQAAGPHSSEFNLYDFPTHNFYRILFHFENGDSDNGIESETGIGDNYTTSFGGMGWGLLHPTWNHWTNEGDSRVNNDTYQARMQDYEYWRYNTAYAYLKMNGEEERAMYLRQFINLLSNINAYSPWYFKSVSGIEEAVERKSMNELKYDELGTLTIECLEDSYDHRIGTLIDLYRAAVFSWQLKKEIIPANLRKFDMTIVVMSVPILGIHHPIDTSVDLYDALGMVGDWLEGDTDDESSYATTNPSQTSSYITSYKSYEFHNCEIDYTQSKASYSSSFSNEQSFSENYKIVIKYEDMYETRYNEFMSEEITDMVLIDSLQYLYGDGLDEVSTSYYPQGIHPHSSPNDTDSDSLMHDVSGYTDSTHEDTLNDRLDSMNASLVDQILGNLATSISTSINKTVIGNMYGFSLSDVINSGSYLSSGSLNSILNAASQLTGSSYYNGLKVGSNGLSNIFEDSMSHASTSSHIGNNIFAKSTLQNNI